jgi:hypothetical protein
VDRGAEVGGETRRGIEEVVEDLDSAALLGYDHAAVGRETDDGRAAEAAERGALLEAWGDR